MTPDTPSTGTRPEWTPAPCPFCGETPATYTQGDGARVADHMENRSSRCPAFGAWLLEAWNRRAALAPVVPPPDIPLHPIGHKAIAERIGESLMFEDVAPEKWDRARVERFTADVVSILNGAKIAYDRAAPAAGTAEPVAWIVERRFGDPEAFSSREDAEKYAAPRGQVAVPLYRAPLSPVAAPAEGSVTEVTPMPPSYADGVYEWLREVINLAVENGRFGVAADLRSAQHALEQLEMVSADVREKFGFPEARKSDRAALRVSGGAEE